MKTKTLSNKETKQFLNKLDEKIRDKIPKKGIFITKEVNNTEIIFYNKKPIFFKYNNIWVPTLHSINEFKFELKTIEIDRGAIPFIVKGADIMRPGITNLDEFGKGEIIVIIDENNKVPLSIGEALFSSEEIKIMKKGKVIKNLHHVNDFIWKLT